MPSGNTLLAFIFTLSSFIAVVTATPPAPGTPTAPAPATLTAPAPATTMAPISCPNSCNSHGNCESNGTCTCYGGWAGTDCSTAICSPACVNGVCQTPGNCNCTADWQGSDCSTPICPGNCYGRGNCTSPNTCTCNTGYGGTDCSTPICNQGCYNGGNCTAPGTCTCSSGWQGSNCGRPLCRPVDCYNGGTCTSAGASTCFCPGVWTGALCNVISTTTFPGNSYFTPDGTSQWTTANLAKTFVPDTIALPTGFNSQPSAPETCCPCGSFVQDGNCYFVLNLPSSFPYMDPPIDPLFSYYSCMQAGGQRATFETGNSVQKMANFFKWLATDANIQTAGTAVDTNSMCAVLGVYWDYSDGKFYWETTPPVEIPSSSTIWYDGHPQNNNQACVIPHKQWPKIKMIDWWGQGPAVICMIRNPCGGSGSVCKPGTPSTAGSLRALDRCVTAGSNNVPVGTINLLDRMEADGACKAQGGTIAAYRQFAEIRYWSFGLYSPSYWWTPWNHHVWVSLNHFTSNYYWQTANVQLASPLHVDWNYQASAPNTQTSGRCTAASAGGWVDQSCSTLFQIACESSVVDLASLTTTTPATTTTAEVATTTVVLDSTTTADTTIAAVTTLTTTLAQTSCTSACSNTPLCPVGYIYNGCYDACYKVVNSNTAYLLGLEDCVDDGGTFVNFNSEDEFNYVMSLTTISTTAKYFIGLQDWVRRVSTNISTINGISQYRGDPDGKWCWMDDSGCIRYSNLIGNKPYWDVGQWNFLKWSSVPYPNQNYGQHPFIAWIKYYGSGQWGIDMTDNNPTADFTANLPYICEINYACKGCPSGWKKFNEYCFKERSSSQVYSSQVTACAGMSTSSNGVPKIWAPKTEGLLINQRMYTDFISPADHNYFVGLQKTASGWKWSDGSLANPSDAFDLKYSHPSGGNDALATWQSGWVNNVYDNQNGWYSLSSSTGTKTVCQIPAVSGLWPVGTNCLTSCSATPICPSGYIYIACYDACYKFVSSTSHYLWALKDCAQDGATFVNFNSASEFNFVMNLPYVSSSANYFIGLQDWGRRTTGSINSVNSISSYAQDPDGNWCWMDDSGCINYNSLTLSGGVYSAPGTWSFLKWSNRPSAPSASGDHPFVTWISYYSTQWRVDMADNNPNANFAAQRGYICELNNMCNGCPTSPLWNKYNGYCFYYYGSVYDYSTQQSNCAGVGTGGNGIPIIWAPRTEGLIVYQRIATDFLYTGNLLTIGLKKIGSTWTWSDGHTAIAGDGFDIKSGEPNSGDDVFVANQGAQWITNVYEGQQGWWGRNSSQTQKTICQISAVPGLWTSSTTSSATTIAPLSCGSTCLTSVACPLGYLYSSCYDSCYKVGTSAKSYFTALSDCAADGATFVNLNSAAEFDYVMSLSDVSSSNKYFIGLQDWTRRVQNGLANVHQLSSYRGDPDGVWCWMDDSGCISYTTLANSSSGFYVPPGTWNFLPWNRKPTPNSNRNAHPFVAWIKYSSSQWFIDMTDNSPNADFRASQYYICEINKACTVCPNGWTKFNEYCFNTIWNNGNYQTQASRCANFSVPNFGVPYLWSPKTEGLLVYQRTYLDFLTWYNIFVVGIIKDSTDTWYWADGSSVSASDAFDFKNNEPQWWADAAVAYPTNWDPSTITNVYDNQNGWSGDHPQSLSRYAVCQIAGNNYLTSATTIATTTMIPTTCVTSSCSSPSCPAGYFYVSCYASCYKIIDSPVRYLSALSECAQDGATFINFNSQDEFNYILSRASGSSYFIGLQDWVRRANGNIRMNGINSYNGDPDGNWCWMDDSGCLSQSNFVPDVNGNFYSAGTWSFLLFSGNAGPDATDNFIAQITNSASGAWLVTTTGMDFTTRSGFICEFNNPCASCPSGWFNYNGYCFLINYNNWQTYGNQQQSCITSRISGYPTPMVWAPKTEGLLVLQRMVTFLKQQSFLIGIITNSSGLYVWSDGTVVDSNDALDLISNWAVSKNYSIQVSPDANYPTTVRDQQTSWVGIDQYAGTNSRICQMGYTIVGSTTTTTTTTTTPCVQDGCCPCGWTRYRDVANGYDICYLFVQTPMIWQDAQMYCAQIGSRTAYGAYLAITDSDSKKSYLTTNPSWSGNSSYWVALAKNSYGKWTWPNDYGQRPTDANLPTAASCIGAVLQKSSNLLVPICNTTMFPFICEIAMSPGSCPVCSPPISSSGLNRLSGGSGSYYISSPLRVSPDKCIWIFNTSASKAQTVSSCRAAGMNPVNLYQAYESRLMSGALQTMNNVVAWIDLVFVNSTAYTSEGEATTYSYKANNPTNNWLEACVSVTSGSQLFYGNCNNKRLPVCTIPSAATCADLCPFGFTAIGGSCFYVESSARVSDPFAARSACFQRFASYNLASLTSSTIVTGLVNLITGLQLANGTAFWIGLDDSIRIGHSTGTKNTITFTADPDGGQHLLVFKVWEMDITGTFPPSTLTTSLWAPGEPFPNNVWAMLVVNETTASIVTTKSPLNPSVNYICERPQPCLQCDVGWTYFNGHCYFFYNSLTAGFRYMRGHCDFLKSYVVSIGSPIEWKFLARFGGSNYFWIGLYRSHGFLNNTKVDASNFHWDEGGRLSDAGFSALASFEPDFNGGTIGSTGIGQFWGTVWYDDPVKNQWPIICEKSARIPTLQCPYIVASGVACGDNLVSPQYTDPASGYTSSSYFETTNGSISMPANGIVLANPWCASPSDSSPWINIDFGSSPVYIRAIATLGGQTVTGMVTAYTVSYQETQGATSYTNLYVHKSVAPMTQSSTVVFAGNAVSTTRNSQEICPRIRAYGVKMVPLSWEVLPVMRIELKGCATSVKVPTHCDCWVESFDIAGWASNYVTVNPYWWNDNEADSFRNTPSQYNDFHQAYPQPSDVEVNRNWHDETDIIGWTPNTVDSQIWWKVIFKVLKMITGFVMRGNSQYNEYITSYYVMWSHTGYEYTFNYYYALDGSPRLFAGPISANSVTQQTFCPPMKALQLKVIPNSWVANPTLVVDIFACMARGRRCYDCCDEIGLCNCNCPVGWTGTSCSTVANDRNYYIDAQSPVCESTELLSSMASSITYAASSGTAANGNGNGPSNITWVPLASDPFHYWQVDFGKVMSISRIQVAGDTAGYVSAYHVWFMVQGSGNMLFYPLLEQQNNPKSALLPVPSSRDYNNWWFIPYRLCPNIRTQSLRLQPNATVGTTPNMRIKIFGCPPHAPCSTCCTHADGCQCKCPVGFATNYQSAATPNPWEHCDEWQMMPVDCEDLLIRSPNLPNGVYVIYPPGQAPISVYCDMTSYGGGWTVIQYRYDSTVDFSKKWIDYRNGFGDLNANFWLGNENIRIITSSVNSYQLLIALTTTDSQLGLAYYNNFYLGSEASGYVLHLSSVDRCHTIGDSLASHVGNRFYTRDNDTSAGSFSCAANSYGGWWYKPTATFLTDCHDSNINGLLQTTSTNGQMATWKTWRGYGEPMVTTKMMIRRLPLPNVAQPLQPQYSPPTDCEDILNANPTAGSGVYTITPFGATAPISVYCEMVALGGGWTVIQRHYDYSLSFNRNFSSYVNGFGSLTGNHWLGLSAIRSIADWQTTMVIYQLAIVVEDTTGEKRTSIYPAFWLDSSGNYALYYVGPQNDIDSAGDGFPWSYSAPFQTAETTSGWPCGPIRPGGWWFKWVYNTNCAYGNLNGAYGNNTLEWGMFWSPWKGRYESLQSATMMLKRVAPKPIDCKDIYTTANNTGSGFYWIFPYKSQPIQVYCDFSSWGGMGGWTVIQQRKRGNTNFSRPWVDYKTGFQSSSTDFWLGNDNVYSITKSAAYSLLVTITYPSSSGTKYYAFYSDFKILSESNGYLLYVSGYDSTRSTAVDGLCWSSLSTFSTYDGGSQASCVSSQFAGGWWYPWCQMVSNLNGVWNNVSISWNGMFWGNLTGATMQTKMAIIRKASPSVINLPFATTKSLCGNLGIIQHQCQHTYQQTSGDAVRLMDPSTPAIYSGEDLLCKPYATPMDCSYFQTTANSSYSKFLSSTRSDLYAQSVNTFTSYCDQETMGGGWTIIQHRVDASQTFQMDTTAYQLPFGSASSNFWLGNSIIQALTNSANYELLVEVKTNLSYGFALYNLFYTSSTVYTLKLGNYQTCSTAGDSLLYSNGRPFTQDASCSGASWWFHTNNPCVNGAGNSSYPTSNLNAPYGPQSPTNKNIYWWTFGNGFSPNLMTTWMKIRRPGTYSRYVMAANFFCDAGNAVEQSPVATAASCQSACTNYHGFTCVTAIFDRNGNCTLRDSSCSTSQGYVDSNYDTYFRMDSCSMVSRCGPPPAMYGTNMEIVNMPGNMSVNYTCRPGFSNSVWKGDNTVLTCDQTSGRWNGQWLECKTLCGDIPDLSPFNAIITPNVVVEGGSVTIYYSCQPDYELIYGDLTRICAPPYGAWSGGAVFCNTTRCNTPPQVSNSWNNYTIPVAISDLTRRYTVWNYTCNYGYVFIETLSKSSTISCEETKLWVPNTPGTCVPLRCETPSIFSNAIITPPMNNFTYFEGGYKINFQCLFEQVLDPQNWDNNVTISCVGNETWSVINYAGATHNWLPTRCVGKTSKERGP